MKKAFFLSIIVIGVAGLCFAQTATLDSLLVGAKTYIEGQLPQGTKVLVADLAAPGRELGTYVAQELSMRLVNGKRLTVVERSDAVMRNLQMESGYQLSGEVSDDSIQGIGHQSGAEIIITGNVTGGGDRYRLNLKMTSVRTSELQGQWGAYFQLDSVTGALLVNNKPAVGIEKPTWIYEPLSVKGKYENTSSGVSEWYYDVGISNKGASEQLARTRARQNIQQVTAENIASDMKARIDITSLSVFQSSGIEDAENRVEAALTNSIRTRVPPYEALEWYVDTGNTDGKDWYIAYVLVRFPRKDIIEMVEKLEPQNIADTAIRLANIPQQNVMAGEREDLVSELYRVRDYSLEMIRTGFSGR